MGLPLSSLRLAANFPLYRSGPFPNISDERLPLLWEMTTFLSSLPLLERAPYPLTYLSSSRQRSIDGFSTAIRFLASSFFFPGRSPWRSSPLPKLVKSILCPAGESDLFGIPASARRCRRWPQIKTGSLRFSPLFSPNKTFSLPSFFLNSARPSLLFLHPSGIRPSFPHGDKRRCRFLVFFSLIAL